MNTHRMRALLFLTLSLLGSMVTLPAQAAQPGTYFSGYYTNAYGVRFYQGYVPTTYNGGAMPLVVALHGCYEFANDFQSLTRLDALAEQRGFIVVFPQQNYYANYNYCWNWAGSGQQSRGSGEPSLIAGITGWVQGNWNIDSDRIHVVGLSAGAAMANIMGATYPDLYASVGSHSGCEFKGYPCGSSGGADPNWSGDQIFSAMGSYERVVPLITFTGTADYVVPAINTDQVVASWAQANDRASDGVDNNNIDATPEQTIPGQVPGGRAYTRYVYNDSSTGQVVEEKYRVTGMAHAWSGGCSCAYYSDPSGPDATSIIYDFFVAHPKQ